MMPWSASVVVVPLYHFSSVDVVNRSPCRRLTGHPIPAEIPSSFELSGLAVAVNPVGLATVVVVVHGCAVGTVAGAVHVTVTTSEVASASVPVADGDPEGPSRWSPPKPPATRAQARRVDNRDAPPSMWSWYWSASPTCRWDCRSPERLVYHGRERHNILE